MTQTTPDSSAAQRAMPANSARVIEITRRAWLATETQPAGEIVRKSQRPRFSRRPIVANLAQAMNFWSTRPL